MKKLFTILFLLPLFVLGQTTVNYTLKDTSGTGFIDTVQRYDCGLIDYFNIGQTIAYPNPSGGLSQHGTAVYFRKTWHELANSYSDLDNYFNNAIDRRQVVNFRVVNVDDSYTGNTVGGFRMAYPASIHTTMQGETNPDFTIGNVWWPNYNSAAFQSAWTTFLTNLVNHLKNTFRTGISYYSVISRKDVDGLGNFGEGHTFVQGAGGSWAWPTGTQWTLASVKYFLDADKAAFPDKPLIGNINFLNDNSRLPSGFGSYYLTQSNSWGLYGMRWDHACDAGTYNYEYTTKTTVENGVNFKTEIANRWKVAPVLGEPQQFNFAAAGQCDYYHVWTEAMTFHPSDIENANNIENGGAVPTCTANLFRSIAKFMGYRLAVTSTQTSDSLIQNGAFMIRSSIVNNGLAPCYDHFNWTFELRQGATVVWSGLSNFLPQFFLPGTTTQVDNFVLPSNLGGNHAQGYNLFLVVRDPTGYRTPMPLQNVNRFVDGSYLLRAGIRIATQGTTPPPPPPPPVNNPPVVLMGADQTDSLPKNTDTLTAQISDPNGDIVSYTWSQTSGPNTATIVTATGSVNTSSGPQTVSTRITGLIEGTYQFRLTVSDGKGGNASGFVNVFVFNVTPPPPPPPPPPVYKAPTIDAGDTIQTWLPKDSVTLTGHVLTKDTAIQSVLWTRVRGSGTTTGTIVTPSDSTTIVRGLSKGYYLYKYTVTDKAGNIVEDFVYVFVNDSTLPQPDPIPLPTGPNKNRIFGIKTE